MKYLLLSTAAFAVVFGLHGCAGHPPKENHMVPAKGDATLQLATMPKKVIADFYLNQSGESCRNFKGSGYVYDWDTENSGGLENLVRQLNFTGRDEVKSIETVIPSGRTVQVAGRHQQYDASCGPVFAEFEPIPAHNYQAYFVMWEKHCRLEVVDVTHPERQILANGFKSIQCKTIE